MTKRMFSLSQGEEYKIIGVKFSNDSGKATVEIFATEKCGIENRIKMSTNLAFLIYSWLENVCKY